MINSLWGQTPGKLPVTKEIFSHLKFSTGCIPSSQIQEKSQKSIFGPKWLTCWKCFFTSNCDFLMRTHPKQAMYDKRNVLQPHVFTGVHTPVAKFKKSHKKASFWCFGSENICWLAAYLNQVLVDPIESDKTSQNLCWFELISWPIGFAAGIYRQERDVDWAEVLVPMR